MTSTSVSLCPPLVDLSYILNCPLFFVATKEEKECKYNGGFFQYIMKISCKDEMQLVFTITATFMIVFPV
jgi:hypothetical protein